MLRGKRIKEKRRRNRDRRRRLNKLRARRRLERGPGPFIPSPQVADDVVSLLVRTEIGDFVLFVCSRMPESVCSLGVMPISPRFSFGSVSILGKVFLRGE